MIGSEQNICSENLLRTRIACFIDQSFFSSSLTSKNDPRLLNLFLDRNITVYFHKNLTPFTLNKLISANELILFFSPNFTHVVTIDKPIEFR